MTRAPAEADLSTRHYLLLAGQLALATWVIGRFQIESRAFARLSLLVLVGFLVHARLPQRFRPAAFALIGMLGVGLVLGTVNALWVLALGGVLLGACILPLPVGWRIAAVLATGGVLAVLRVELLPVPWSSAIWPVLGSMFALRMIVYLYDRSHGVDGGSRWETVSYFFLLPNVCFPLFPVVDYKTYRRSYYGEPAWQCHQTGMAWITRGLVHLLLYRWIYYYVVLAPSEVESAVDLTRYLVSNYALYLRVSGTFHLVIGIVRLFGHALPETNFRYFLAASVNDFWRRANIYWKDFMLKVVYYPTFFGLRRGGERLALVVATLAVVTATWGLHSYQWFWLRGDFLLRWQDGVFWTVLGLAMIGTTFYERSHARARGRRARTGRLFDAGRLGAIVLTFCFIAVLWSLWTCESLAEWLRMWSAVGDFGGGTAAAGLGVPLLLVALLGAAPRRLPGRLGRLPLATRQAAATLTVLSVLLALSLPAIYTRLGERASGVIQSLRAAKLNRLDAERLQRGYYEDLLDVDRFNTELWSVFRSKPTDWRELHETTALEVRDDFLGRSLKPEIRTVYKGHTLTTNRWGMRDRDYALEKPAMTTRIAVFGGSIVMGAGVDDGETFENVLEDRLAGQPGLERFEVLNFGVGGYSALQRLRALEIQGLRFSPDVAVFVAHENELFRLERHLAAVSRRGVQPPYPELRRLLDAAGFDQAETRESFSERLKRFDEEILSFAYRRFVEVCRSRGIRPVWVFLPTLEVYADAADVARFEEAARRAGFETIDLFGLWERSGRDRFSLRLADWDYHPNAEGHRVIAESLYEELAARPWLLGREPGGEQPPHSHEEDAER